METYVKTKNSATLFQLTVDFFVFHPLSSTEAMPSFIVPEVPRVALRKEPARQLINLPNFKKSFFTEATAESFHLIGWWDVDASQFSLAPGEFSKSGSSSIRAT
jgi:hypothetical protein